MYSMGYLSANGEGANKGDTPIGGATCNGRYTVGMIDVSTGGDPCLVSILY